MSIEAVVTDFGPSNDPAIWPAAISALMGSGGGTLYVPPALDYSITSPCVLDYASKSSRWQNLINIVGAGSASVQVTAVGSAFHYAGKVGYPESHFGMSGMRIIGTGLQGVGLDIDVAAWCGIKDVVIEGFDTNLRTQDAEQFQVEDFCSRWGTHGTELRGAAGSSDPNSIVFNNVTVSNNYKTGITGTHLNAFTMNGGSVQYNGIIGPATDEYGFRSIDMGSGYGTAEFVGVAFEGNGGLGDFVSDQNINPAIISFEGCGFTRTSIWAPKGYGKNHVALRGNRKTHLILSGNRYMHGVGYVPSAARPYFDIANPLAKVFHDGSDIYDEAVEAPPWANTATVPGSLTVGRTSPIGPFSVHVASNANFFTIPGFLPGGGVAFGGVNDANTSLIPFEIRTSRLSVSNMQTGNSGLPSGSLYVDGNNTVKRVP
jgi:hypothetical protein